MADNEETLNVELPEALAVELMNATKDKEIRIQRFVAKETKEFLEVFRPKVKDVKNFWLIALLNDPVFSMLASSPSDREALRYLSDIELVQDLNDPRPYEIIFHFAENPYFTNKTLSKKYSLPDGVEAAPADGTITESMREFDDDDLIAGTTTIDWKEGQDLCAKFPRGAVAADADADAEDFDGDGGSFFHYFTVEGDAANLGGILANEILMDPLRAFEGDADDEDFDSQDEDELDDEDEEEGSIDLEDDEDSHKKKKQKV